MSTKEKVTVSPVHPFREVDYFGTYQMGKAIFEVTDPRGFRKWARGKKVGFWESMIYGDDRLLLLVYNLYLNVKDIRKELSCSSFESLKPNLTKVFDRIAGRGVSYGSLGRIERDILWYCETSEDFVERRLVSKDGLWRKFTPGKEMENIILLRGLLGLYAGVLLGVYKIDGEEVRLYLDSYYCRHREDI